MTEKYYLDTSIWMDYYEDRLGYDKEPLGDYAWKLLTSIKSNGPNLIITDLLIKELEINYSIEELNGMMKFFEDILEKIISTKEQREEAEKISRIKNVPVGDVLHSILARDNKLILITRDKHFNKLKDISKHYKPEDII